MLPVSHVLAIVPARGGSKGVPGKNVRVLAGRPLIDYTARAARESGVIDRIVLSTDSDEIADAGRRSGLEVPFMRPASLAADDTPMLPVVRHAIDALSASGWTPDVIVLLQPTSPLRRPSHVRDAVTMLRETKADSVVTVVELPRHLSPDYVMRIEDGVLRPFLPDGARADPSPGCAAGILERRHRLRVLARDARSLRHHLRRALPAAARQRRRLAVD